MTSGLFLSYSSRDRDHLDNLLSALRRADEQVWFDDQLGGGDVWWQQILDRIRGCDVFLFALSHNSLQSKPCMAELQYAQALQKPVLPIQIGPVGSMRITPLATVEAIDFQTPTVDSGIRLITAVQRARQRGVDLPSPLPEEPPVPFAYLMHLATAISDAEIDPQHQAEIVAELKAVVAQDGDDDSTRGDIAQLLRSLSARSDATEETRSAAAGLLAALGNTEAPTEQEAATKSSPRKLLAVAVAALAVLAAAGLAVFTIRDRPHQAPAQSATQAPPPVIAPTVLPPKLESILLSVADVDTVMGTTGIKPEGPISSGLSSPTTTSSDPDCMGAGDAAVDAVYKDSGWTTAREQILSQPNPDDPTAKVFWVDQAAIGFPTATQAQDFLNRSANRWTGCSRRIITEQGTDGVSTSWTYGELLRDNNTLSIPLLEEGGDDWGCQHTVSAYSNTVLEAVACAYDISDQSARIVAKMLEKARA